MNHLKIIIQHNYCWLQWVGRIWALPYTIIGLLLGLLGRNDWQVSNRTIEVLLHNGPVYSLCNALCISAFTLGDCVLYAAKPCRNLRVHEGRHTKQYWILGPLFLPVYYILLAFYGYWNHPLEKDARRWELEQCGCLYTSSIEKSQEHPYSIKKSPD